MTADTPREHTEIPVPGSGPQAPPERAGTAPRRPRAMSILVGLFSLAVAGFVLATELGSLTIDWSTSGPYLVIGSGLVIAVVGAVGLVGARRS